MGRAPCCDKVGLKKGPWSPEEDQILVSFINQYGHSNWRALPKQAGLLRCGKSCRLRWMNYLKPDIKRGNFTKEEEETIIHLHNIMGNRWSAIAARLPGRTDNEIKNIWHTHLKKKLGKHQTTKTKSKVEANTTHDNSPFHVNNNNNSYVPTISNETTSVGTSHQSYTTSDGFSSSTEVSSIHTLNNSDNVKIETEQNFDNIRQSDMDNYCPIIDETFWSYQDIHQEGVDHDMSTPMDSNMGYVDNTFSSMYEGKGLENHGDNINMDYFWLDVFLRSEDEPELPEF